MPTALKPGVAFLVCAGVATGVGMFAGGLRRLAVAGGSRHPSGLLLLQQQQPRWVASGSTLRCCSLFTTTTSTNRAGGAAAEGGEELTFDGRVASEIPMEELERAKPPKNSLVGKVVSTAMQKSIMVRVERLRLLTPLMVRKKTFKKIMAHDEENTCRLGDLVRIKPSRPLSKRKRFTLHEIIKRDPKLEDFDDNHDDKQVKQQEIPLSSPTAAVTISQ